MNPTLIQAQHAVQDRKLAAGVPQFRGIMDTEMPDSVNASEHPGIMSGTDLVDGDVTELADYCARAMLNLIVLKGADPLHAMIAMYREGLLVGIEYAKRAAL